MAFSFIYGMVCVIFGKTADLDGLKTVLDLLLAPVVALVGSVAGFYFGEKSK